MKFNEILPALESGERVARESGSWFIYKANRVTITARIVPDMISLPPKVREYFIGTEEAIHFINQTHIVYLDNTINSWVPSQDDLYADDWVILD